MNKSALRKRMIAYLKQISKREKATIEHRLVTHLLKTTIWKDASVIGLTISQDFEWDTNPIVKQAWKEGKTVAVPKCNSQNKQLTFYKIKDYKDLKKGYANIMEPDVNEANRIDKQHIHLLIVPGIMFDQFGYRIGFGGGYYDRYLTDFNGDTVSIASNEQLIDRLPVDSYDIPVKYLITESGCKNLAN